MSDDIEDCEDCGGTGIVDNPRYGAVPCTTCYADFDDREPTEAEVERYNARPEKRIGDWDRWGYGTASATWLAPFSDGFLLFSAYIDESGEACAELHRENDSREVVETYREPVDLSDCEEWADALDRAEAYLRENYSAGDLAAEHIPTDAGREPPEARIRETYEQDNWQRVRVEDIDRTAAVARDPRTGGGDKHAIRVDFDGVGFDSVGFLGADAHDGGENVTVRARMHIADAKRLYDQLGEAIERHEQYGDIEATDDD